ncbi:DUF4142 domain-containing protein [Flavihumibacter petaseus]|uniref:DUF4142 domain-containing protein n=1 Tax=Flavihumibacter petaseus NBRC 106054 TaxID=1220578 RepID=A0A0E9MZB1_9BACT|nr:DUF4142 domain-containing protein [Flavihumibacter petaseus]GAO42435.1 hypothetical protein FPE01S_01_14500 [Flavihumibacter petaseus NBRC 106054]
MMNTKHFLLVATVAATLGTGFTACNNAANTEDKSAEKVAEEKNDDKFTTKTSEKDAQFVVDVVAANRAEIKYAQLAQQKSTNAEIKKVAAHLESAHEKLLASLEAIAKTKAISYPTDVTDDARKDIDKLADDKNFNKEWCKTLVDKHEKTISKLESASTETTDSELKSWIDNALPEVRMHLDELKKCDATLKK